MKRFSILVCMLLLGMPAREVSAADPAVVDIKKGFASYFSMMDQMQAGVHKVRDAKATAKLLDEWVRAHEILLNTTAKYNKQFPEAVNSKTPPPELANEMKKIADAKFTYGSLTSDLSVLVKTFADDPAVKAALERRQKAMKKAQGG
jgi:hypothetical protein